MSQRILIDSSIYVSLERGDLIASKIFNKSEKPILCSIVFAELLVGIQMDSNPSREAQKLSKLEAFKSACTFVNFEEAESRALAELQVLTRRSGRQRGKYDLMLAATAKVLNAVIWTHDRSARFADLPGVSVKEI